jgi:hypothetical protein
MQGASLLQQSVPAQALASAQRYLQCESRRSARFTLSFDRDTGMKGTDDFEMPITAE